MSDQFWRLHTSNLLLFLRPGGTATALKHQISLKLSQLLLAKHPSISSPVFCISLLSEAQRCLGVEGPCVPPGCDQGGSAKQLGGEINGGLDGLCDWWERMYGTREGEGGMPLSLDCRHSVRAG